MATGSSSSERERKEGRRQRPVDDRRLLHVRRTGHHRPRRPRGGSQAPGHVHRIDRRDGPAPSRLRGRRQLRRRGAGRLLHEGLRHGPPGQLGHGHRQRPRDPRRDHGEGGPAGRPGRADRAALRRQVRRRRRLQGLRRPARRRRVGRQRAVRAAPRRDPPRRPRLHAGLLARRRRWRARRGREARRGRRDGHDRHVPARRRHLRVARLRLPHARGAPARDGLPHARPGDLDRRRARRGALGDVPLRGRDRGLRLLSQREQGDGAPQGDLLRRRERGGRGGDRDAVELLLPGLDPLVRQQHQHARGRLAHERLPLGAHAHAEQVRARPRPAEGERGQPHRRGRARGTDGGDLGQAARPAVRGPDEDQARQPRHGRLRRVDRQHRASASSSRRTRARRAR